MNGSILTVHVVEARDLRPMDMSGSSDPYVILDIEEQQVQTNYRKSTLNPVWNESFTFDITNGNNALRVVIMDKDTFGNDDFQGECHYELDNLRDQMKHDVWLDLRDRNSDVPTQGRIRLMLQWVYSKVQYFNEYLGKWDETLFKDVEEKEKIELYLQQLENPWGFLDTMKGLAEEDELDEPQNAAEAAVKAQEAAIKDREVQVLRTVDAIGLSVASKAGFDYVPWYTVTKIVLFIYGILTLCVLFVRPDFINLTIVTASTYMILDPDKIRRTTFRLLVLAIFITLVYDIIWLVLLQEYDSA